MKTRTRAYLFGSAAAIISGWCAAQLWLTHRAYVLTNGQAHARALAWDAAHPGRHLQVTDVQASYWTHAGIEGCAAMLLIVGIAAVLAAGGRRWWTLLVAALPAAVVVGHFVDGMSVGQGWVQPTDSVQAWLAVGVSVDTITLLAVATILVFAMPRPRPLPAIPVLFRTAPAAVILVGWWLVRHPIADASARIWLAQAVVWVVLVGLVATASAPFIARCVTLSVVMPLLSFTILDNLIGTDGRGFDATRYLHHLAVAAGITAYGVVLPRLQRLLHPRPALSVS